MGDGAEPTGVHSSDPALGAALTELFAQSDWLGEPIELSWADGHPGDDTCAVDRLVEWGVGGFGQPPTELPAALVLIVQRQLRLALEDDPARLHLHGALVGCPEESGARVLLLGASGAGKSTMAAQLVHLGVAYATDEMVAVDPDGRIEAVRKPLKLRQAARERYDHLESLVHPLIRGGEGDVPLAPDAGQWLETDHAPLSDVVVLSRHDGGAMCAEACPALAPVPAVTMTRRMAENAFDFSRFGVGASLLSLARLAAKTRCWELSYCDSASAAPLLAELARPDADRSPHVGVGVPPSTRCRPRPDDHEPIHLVGDALGTDGEARVGLRVGGPGLVCRPEGTEHVVVELNQEAFDIWESGRLGHHPSEISNASRLPPDTVQACLTMLRDSDLL